MGIINKKRITIELRPELDACVQTQAKREYNKTFSELINKAENEELAEKIELLRLFLESADFKKLRGKSEKHLQEGKEVIFRLYLADGEPEYEMIVT
ncbi:MAG: hypothetical protein JSW16_03970 [Dehalococcoidales bacterium]|nr:MAG: hypothetical protein JSW16_03970 [Dehalococcoidales bacterium]